MATDTTATAGRLVKKELFIRATPERVYRAFTDETELNRWFVTRAEVDLRPGGVFDLTWRPGEFVHGTFIEVDPPSRVVFDWDERPKYGLTRCEVSFIPENDGTRLILVHSGFGTGDDWDEIYDGIKDGWNHELEYLRAWLEDGRAKEWS